MNLALIGPSGAGKGTHAKQLVEQHPFASLVTGDLLRENVARRRAVGFLAEKYISQGVLVPDEVINAMVAEWAWALDPGRDVLFDGYPRTLSQAQFLDDLFAQLGRRMDGVIYLHVTPAEITRRLQGRLVCDGCRAPYHLEFHPPARAFICDDCGESLSPRPDDIQEMIRVRLRSFRRAVGPVLEYYADSGRLVVVDGMGDPGQVLGAARTAVEQIGRGAIPPVPAETLERIRASLRADGAGPAGLTPGAGFDAVLVGGPGSGKGTQAAHLRTHFNLLHIASGDLFRENIRLATGLGKLAKSYIDRGRLVPDDVTEAMVEERISRPDAAGGFILDGFPRTLPQAQALAEMMAGMQRALGAVLYIRVSDEEIIRRLSGRRICRECQTPFHLDFNPPARAGVCDVCGGELYQRDDDNPNTVRARLQIFHEQTRPILEYYDRAGLLAEVDGEGAVAEVSARTEAAFRTRRR